jgi:O-methyltransferase involved in polyketide biosynthesis
VEATLRVDLEGVPETLLWTLYHRALEARRADAVLHDPKAVELVDAIDYPFEEHFGVGAGGQAQWQALRVRRFDLEVERFLEAHPDGTVVALGEGLETQFWRVDNGRVRWLTVELPETVGVRRQLLPPSSRQRVMACSALDVRWMREVDSSRGVLLTAQGLLMYFEYDEVRRLIAACAEWFPGGELLFDAVPCWLSVRSRSGKLSSPGNYRPPPWHWGLNSNTARDLAAVHPRVSELRELPLPRGRGAALGHLVPLMSKASVLRRRLPISVLLARFG